jgi:hypothetical protein
VDVYVSDTVYYIPDGRTGQLKNDSTGSKGGKKKEKDAYLDVFQAGESNEPTGLVEYLAFSILKDTFLQETCKVQIFGNTREQFSKGG